MVKNKLLIVFAISALVLVQLACGITINTGGEQVTIPIETSIAMTIAALPAGKPANPQGVVINPTATLPPAPLQQDTPTPSPTPLPCNWAKLVSENVADGTSININTNFNKSWRIKNIGTCTWNSNYKIVYYSGSSMGGPASKNFSGNVAPGETIDLVLSLKAPGTAGTYKGYWHLFGDDNIDFTQSKGFWVSINAVSPVGPFAVTSVHVSAEHETIEGACPLSFHIGADITVNSPGTVTFWFQHSDGSVSAASSVTFAAAGTKLVTENWSRNATGNYWAKIYINAPNHQWFGPVNLHLTCS